LKKHDTVFLTGKKTTIGPFDFWGNTPLNLTFGVDAKSVLATKTIVIRVIFYLL
jgi:hypothetical protein|tara:strand:- start:294 stop:455 length:162 start_codon:yes stop_codon:yes gene_type:complete